MVRILPFQGRGPGSIPGWRIFLFLLFCCTLNGYYECSDEWIENRANVLQYPFIFTPLSSVLQFSSCSSAHNTNCLKQVKMTIASGYSGSCFLRPLQRPSSQLGWSSPGPLPASPSLPSASGSAAHRSLSSLHLSSTFNSSPFSTSEITSASLLISLSTPLFSLFTCFSNSRLRICSLLGCSTLPGTKSCSYEGAFNENNHTLLRRTHTPVSALRPGEECACDDSECWWGPTRSGRPFLEPSRLGTSLFLGRWTARACWESAGSRRERRGWKRSTPADLTQCGIYVKQRENERNREAWSFEMGMDSMDASAKSVSAIYTLEASKQTNCFFWIALLLKLQLYNSSILALLPSFEATDELFRSNLFSTQQSASYTSSQTIGSAAYTSGTNRPLAEL